MDFKASTRPLQSADCGDDYMSSLLCDAWGEQTTVILSTSNGRLTTLQKVENVHVTLRDVHPQSNHLEDLVADNQLPLLYFDTHDLEVQVEDLREHNEFKPQSKPGVHGSAIAVGRWDFNGMFRRE